MTSPATFPLMTRMQNGWTFSYLAHLPTGDVMGPARPTAGEARAALLDQLAGQVLETDAADKADAAINDLQHVINLYTAPQGVDRQEHPSAIAKDLLLGDVVGIEVMHDRTLTAGTVEVRRSLMAGEKPSPQAQRLEFGRQALAGAMRDQYETLKRVVEVLVDVQQTIVDLNARHAPNLKAHQLFAQLLALRDQAMLMTALKAAELDADDIIRITQVGVSGCDVWLCSAVPDAWVDDKVAAMCEASTAGKRRRGRYLGFAWKVERVLDAASVPVTAAARHH